MRECPSRGYPRLVAHMLQNAYIVVYSFKVWFDAAVFFDFVSCKGAGETSLPAQGPNAKYGSAAEMVKSYSGASPIHSVSSSRLQSVVDRFID